MRVLAIDTALDVCSAAVLDTTAGGITASETLTMARGHAEALLPLDHDALRAAGLSPQKIRYIRDLTERVSTGQLDLEQVSELDDEVAIAELVKVKGIGRWTAEMMLIFSLGRPDVLPVDDLGFLEGVREAYSLDARPTPKEMRERGEIWRPYRTFATWYMWGVRRLAMKYEKERTRIVSL